MYHLLAWSAAIGNTADTDVAAVTDQIISVQNSHFVLPQNQRLLVAAAMSATLSRAKIVSPTLRQIANPYVRPIIEAVQPGANPNVMNVIDYPMQLTAFEEIQILATSAVAMGTEQMTALAWIGDGVTPIPMAQVYPLRWTSTTACVANKWTDLVITFEQVIPSGVYVMTFTEHFSTNAQAHRWIFSNQVPRPGSFSFAANTSRCTNAIAFGRLGQMGTFRSNDLPRVQVLANGTDNSHEGYAWACRVGSLA